MSSAVQTVIVSKDVADSRAKATKIAHAHASRIYTSRETGSSFRFRQRPPGDFKPGSFKTRQIREGVSVVTGELKKGK